MKTNVKINGQTVEIELTEEQINQLQQATNPKSFKRWRADEGGEYWVGAHYASGVGSVSEYGDDADSHFYAIGDYFKTKKEALEYRKCVLKKQEILDFILEKNEGWTPVLDGCNSLYIIKKTEDSFSIDCWNYCQYAPKSYYFKSKEIGEELIEKFGNDLKYLFV